MIYTFIINLYKYMIKVEDDFAMEISARPQTMKKVNSVLIKQILKKKGSATKAEIAEAAGISSTTVRSLLNELLSKKEISSVGLDKSNGGRRAERYMLNLSDNFVLAFYIGDNYIDYVITNPLDEVIEGRRIQNCMQNPIDSVDKFVGSIIKNNPCIKMIGISASGIVDGGKYITGKKFDEFKEFNFGEHIQNKYGISVVLENDLNSTAIGFSLNLMKKLDIGNDDMSILDMIYIQFSKKGIGAGIISGGKLIHGSANFAGELGFMPILGRMNLNSIIDSDIDDETYIDTIARMIAILNCVTNPGFMVIGGEILRLDLMDKIKNRCRCYIKESIMPDIFCAYDSEKDCLKGIAYLADEFMYSGIKLTCDTDI